jgi:disease resistance protein RPM1
MAAAAVVSVSMGVMKPILAKLATLMGDEYKKIKGLRKEVDFLQRELGDMDALLEKMDCADELDPQAKKWRRDIIEMSYNIEDRIDHFMHTVGEADSKIGILEKAAKYLRTFKDRRRLANDFQEIKTQVVEASERRKRYMLDQRISVAAPVVVDPRVSALYKESASLVGIESQKDELVSWEMDEVKQLKFMAIVGFGGIGKTTLANEVYREVGGKFKYKAFISVSQKPQLIALFNSFLSQLGLQTYSHACQLQDPINNIREHLQDKRYSLSMICLINLEGLTSWNYFISFLIVW